LTGQESGAAAPGEVILEETKDKKKRMLSGIQPSGELHLGNYLGAIKNWADRVNEYECYYFMADLHTITVRQDPAELRKRSVQQLAQYIACGLDPEKNTLFIQSHVPQHAELGWILGCYTQFGELSRMTQFKAKSQQHADNITAGLFTYPVLMAADILLYQADLVPVGEDQKQHVELTRDIAVRFNGVYSDTFVLPEPFIPKMGARIMSLDDPATKMSKSMPEGCVNLMDPPEVIMKKFKRAVTDCETAVRFDKVSKPGISNLLTIYCAATGKTLEDAEAAFAGQGYGVFKPAVGEAVVELFRPIREESERIMKDKAYLESVYRTGAQRAQYLANKTLAKVQRKIGFVPR
jgi:tryptophanyl-tRNA synthetase